MIRRKYSILAFVLMLVISLSVLMNVKKNADSVLDETIQVFFKLSNTNPIINPHEFKYILNPGKTVCENSGRIDLLMLVTSAAYNFDHRRIIRNTWANHTLFPTTKAVFIVGDAKNTTINRLLVEEFKLYGDIVQEDFIDTYTNLTIKTIAAMKWGSLFCNGAKFMLKIDDDLIVNSHALMPFVESYDKPLRKTILCLINHKSLVIRDPTSKFYVTKKMFNEEFYQTYCNGNCKIKC